MASSKWEPGMLSTNFVEVPEAWQAQLGVPSFEAHIGGSVTEGGVTTTTVCWKGVNYLLRVGFGGWIVIGVSENQTKMFDNSLHPFNIDWDDEKIKSVVERLQQVRIEEIQVEFVGVTRVRYRGRGCDWTDFTLNGDHAITFKDDQQALSFVERFKQIYSDGETIHVTVERLFKQG